MAEKLDEWPRVHSCLYDWCPEKRDECRRCDAVAKLLMKGRESGQSYGSPLGDFR